MDIHCLNTYALRTSIQCVPNDVWIIYGSAVYSFDPWRDRIEENIMQKKVVRSGTKDWLGCVLYLMVFYGDMDDFSICHLNYSLMSKVTCIYKTCTQYLASKELMRNFFLIVYPLVFLTACISFTPLYCSSLIAWLVNPVYFSRIHTLNTACWLSSHAPTTSPFPFLPAIMVINVFQSFYRLRGSVLSCCP